MKIAMFTNDYEPIVGGVSRSISTFAEDLRQLGHDVLVVTLTFPGISEPDDHVFRLPSLEEIGGTEFSLKLPLPAGLADRLDTFGPDVIHSHHPFMVGDTALRAARRLMRPLVFTHHTRYERYTYLFSEDSETLSRMAEAVATEYANLCDRVLDPTQSIKDLITERGVNVPVHVIPSGIDLDFFSHGDGHACRDQYRIPEDAFLIGYVGRVVDAKNMGFLAQAAVRFLENHRDARFLVVGEGESLDPLRARMKEASLSDRLVSTGSLSGKALANAYAAIDVFMFASKTETQGIVLSESLCAGTPVIALDAPGSRDVIEDGKCGVLLPADASPAAFADALAALYDDPARLDRLVQGARRRAQRFDRRRCAEELVTMYTELMDSHTPHEPPDLWLELQQRFGAEWDLFREKMAALMTAFSDNP